jgi:hypothetical protein
MMIAQAPQWRIGGTMLSTAKAYRHASVFVSIMRQIPRAPGTNENEETRSAAYNYMGMVHQFAEWTRADADRIGDMAHAIMLARESTFRTVRP